MKINFTDNFVILFLLGTLWFLPDISPFNNQGNYYTEHCSGINVIVNNNYILIKLLLTIKCPNGF